MAGFWYPYDGLADARAHLCGFADGAIGPQCGVSFSDGTSIVVLRRPASGRSRSTSSCSATSSPPDTAGVALDVVGVAAGVVFLVFVAPELAAAGTVAGAVGIATGISAATGSFILAFIDGGTYVAEISGNDALAKKIDDNNTLQWMRIGATLMLLPDFGVGGMRALQEIGKLGREVNEGREAVVASSRSVAEARARVARIHHPERHPGPVMRRIHKVRAFQRAAEAQARAANLASHRIHTIALRDLALFQGATLAGTGLLSAAPPGVALTPEQNRRDEDYLKSLTPRGGMPKDIRLEMRIFGFEKPR